MNDTFCVLDYSNPYDIDFFWRPVRVLDHFTQPGALLRLGPYSLTLPWDWSIVICERNHGMVETIEVKNIGERQFDAFALNPLGYMPDFLPISITSVVPDTEFTIPRIRPSNFLALPVESGARPLCVFALCQGGKLPDALDIGKIFA